MAAHLALDEATEVRPLASQRKVCSGCDTAKPHSEFHKNTCKKDGLQSLCKPCKSRINRDANIRTPRLATLAAQKAARRLAARNYVREYLQAHPCVDCGEDDWVVLEFDHVRGDKDGHLGVMVGGGYSLARIVSEIEKCDVRCANCHRRITALRAGFWRVKDLKLGE